MKLKFLILIVFILRQSFVWAQIAWLPMDENLGNFPIATSIISGNQLISAQATNGIGFRQATLKLNKWNGQFWVTYPPIFAEQFIFSLENKMAVTMHNNQFYMAGSFNSDDRTKVGVINWDGNAWKLVGKGIESDYVIHKEISVSDMVSYNNQLFVCGQFNIADEKPVYNFVVLQSGNWNNIETGKGNINDLHILKDSMYAGGLFNQMVGKPTFNLAANFKGNWYPVSSPSAYEIIGLSSLDSNLIAITQKQIFLRTSSGWNSLSNQWDYSIEHLGSSAEFEGKFYIAGTFKNSLGTISHLLKWDGVSWLPVVSESDILPMGEKTYFVNKRDKELIFSGNIKAIFGKPVNNYIRLFPNKTVVTGKVFIDKNKNCTFDFGESPVENAILNLNDSYYTSTDANGNYSLVLDESKKSSVKIFPGENYELSCVSETIEISTLAKDSMLNLDFPFSIKPQPFVPKYSITSASGFKARHGYSTGYTIYCNAPAESYPIELKLNFDKRISFGESDIKPGLNDSTVLKWTLQKNGSIRLNFLINPDLLNSGDSLTFNLSGRPVSASGYSPENIILKQVVSSAFDPNEKQCNKAEMEEGEMELDYHIQFQNLGNDSAVNINIVDTIDPGLPIQFIKIKEYSEKHKQNVSYKVRNHAIIWSFKDIYLPSKSMSDDSRSSGYISFRSYLAPGLKVGDIIANKAEIYFDFQDPVVTNRVVTKIIKPHKPTPGGAKGNLILYPNPSVNGKITIEFSPYLIQKVEVFDLAGRNLYSKQVNANSKTDIDLNNLSQGVYIINVTHSVGSISEKLVIQR